MPANTIAAALLKVMYKSNPTVYVLPKEVFEGKKGKDEGGRQMGSGTTAVDVFGNPIIQGCCRFVSLSLSTLSSCLLFPACFPYHVFLSHFIREVLLVTN